MAGCCHRWISFALLSMTFDAPMDSSMMSALYCERDAHHAEFLIAARIC